MRHFYVPRVLTVARAKNLRDLFRQLAPTAFGVQGSAAFCRRTNAKFGNWNREVS